MPRFLLCTLCAAPITHIQLGAASGEHVSAYNYSARVANKQAHCPPDVSTAAYRCSPYWPRHAIRIFIMLCPSCRPQASGTETGCKDHHQLTPLIDNDHDSVRQSKHRRRSAHVLSREEYRTRCYGIRPVGYPNVVRRTRHDARCNTPANVSGWTARSARTGRVLSSATASRIGTDGERIM